MKLHQKTGWVDFDELRVTDSTLTEGTNSLVTSKLRKERWFIMHCRTITTIKPAMAGIQEWWHLFTPLLVY